MRPGWTYFGSFKHVIPDRRSAKVNVEVRVAAFYTHETIPAAGNTEGTEKDVEKAKKKTLKDSSRNAPHKRFSSENCS